MIIDSIFFLEKVKNILSDILEVDFADVPLTMDTSIVDMFAEDSLSLSSIDYVRFLINIEDQFNVVFRFEDRMVTLGDIYRYINNYLEGQ